MFLRCNKRKKDGKVHRYYNVVENRRVVQKPVLYLGEISDSQKKSWNKSIKVLNEENQPVQKTLFALHDDETVCENIDVS